MRRFDEGPADPMITASLDAVDATLAGEPVDPSHAELAELALLLAAERPPIDSAFASSLDAAVQRRFVSVGPGAQRKSGRRLWWLWTPAAGLAAILVAAVVIVSTGGSSHSPTTTVASSTAKVPAPSAARPGLSTAPHRASTASSASSGAATAASGAASLAPNEPPPFAAAASLQPVPNGRKVIQGAQLALTARASRLDQVAQEVFGVVGQVGGIVRGSTVTAAAGPGGYAQFELSIPSSELSRAMTSLSSLRYTRVASRTDTTQDVNDQYQAYVRALADARSLRTSLLKQLATAGTQTEITSLTARIHDAEASISSDQARLRKLGRQINYSQVSVTINGAPLPVPVHSAGGFGLGRAAHDAGRVLTVAAGIALIAAAALLPAALLGAFAWWIAVAVRRRRREQALDLV